MKLRVNLDLTKNQLKNAVFENLSTAPDSPKVGQFYYNSSEKLLKIWDGSAWKSAGEPYVLPKATTSTLGGVIIGTNVDVSDGKISIKDASTANKGVIQIATDAEASTGTLETVAVNPKQLHDASTTASASAVAAVVAMKGQNNGIAPLDTNGKVPVAHIPDTIMTGMYLGGSFDASGIVTVTTQLQSRIKISDATIQLINSATDDTTQTPKEYGYKTLEGAYFLADATFEIGGVTFEVGDWLVGFGTKWAKIDNTDAVVSVNGKVGVVTITKGDVSLGNVANSGDSAIPVADGSTKFTTGGAFTELAKKVNIKHETTDAGKTLYVNADGNLELANSTVAISNTDASVSIDTPSGWATWTIANPFGTANVQISVIENADGSAIGMDIVRTAGTITIRWNAEGTAPAANTYSAVITR